MEQAEVLLIVSKILLLFYYHNLGVTSDYWGNFKSSLNCNISKAILFFLLFFSDSAPHHSDVSLGTNFEFMKVFWFEEERRMCDISSVRIKQPFLTYFCIIMIFIFICSETRRAECSKKPCMSFHFYAVFHL